jgi:hypothetical protein
VPTFFLAAAAPHTGVLVGSKSEFEALFLASASHADFASFFDLSNGQTCGPDWKEQLWIGV